MCSAVVTLFPELPYLLDFRIYTDIFDYSGIWILYDLSATSCLAPYRPFLFSQFAPEKLNLVHNRYIQTESKDHYYG